MVANTNIPMNTEVTSGALSGLGDIPLEPSPDISKPADSTSSGDLNSYLKNPNVLMAMLQMGAGIANSKKGTSQAITEAMADSIPQAMQNQIMQNALAKQSTKNDKMHQEYIDMMRNVLNPNTTPNKMTVNQDGTYIVSGSPASQPSQPNVTPNMITGDKETGFIPSGYTTENMQVDRTPSGQITMNQETPQNLGQSPNLAQAFGQSGGGNPGSFFL